MINTDDLFENNRFLDIYPHKYVLRCANSNECVVIDLMSANISKENTQETIEDKKSIGIKAVYGIVQLKQEKYLVAATKSKLSGTLYNKHIFNLTQMEFFPITADKQVKSQDKVYINMMQNWFQTKSFYFSEFYDLTNNFQKFIKNQTDVNKFNSSFCYNECYMSQFLNIEAYDWICPFICGFISFKYSNLDQNGQQNGCEFILISRRDKRKAGTRFWSRGANLDGNTTNQAETEQIFIQNKDQEVTIYSHTQTRGLMPFLWSSQPNMKWAPSGVIIGEKNDNVEICKRHFDDQVSCFGKQICVNLIDKNSSRTQKMLGNYFDEMVNSIQNKLVKLIWFDFHHECKNMKYENLSKLINQIEKDLQQQGYFEFSYNKQKPLIAKVNNMQKGVVRTNCMDCLDRTNVVQSVISRYVFLQILYSAQMIPKPSGQALQNFPDKLEQIFRDNWTQNADILSILYTGTGALKTDFTRTGKRTMMGAIQDGKNSIHRYFLNNFTDSNKQNQLDLLLNKIDPKKQQIQEPYNRLLITFFIGYLLFSILSGALQKIIPGQTQNIIQFQNQNTNQYITSIIIQLASLGIVLKFLQLINKLLVPAPINLI